MAEISGRKGVKMMTVTELCAWLSERLEDAVGKDCIDILKKNLISGQSFLELTDEEVKELFPLIGARKAISRVLSNFKPQVQVQPLQIGSSTGWLSSFKIPRQFSRSTMDHLAKNELTDKMRIEIISTIGLKMYQETTTPTSEEYTTVCKMLVAEYPLLRDSCGNGYGSWKQQLRRKFKNMRRPSKRLLQGEKGSPQAKQAHVEVSDDQELHRDLPAEDNEASMIDDTQTDLETGDDAANFAIETDFDEDMNYEKNIELLRQECEKEKRDRKAVRELMDKTTMKRREWIKDMCPKVEDVLKKFPPLCNSLKNLWREFGSCLSSNLPDDKALRNTWEDLIVKIQRKADIEMSRVKLTELRKKQAEEALITVEEDIAKELQELHCLELLTFLLAPRAKGCITQRFENVSDVSEEAKKVCVNYPYIGVTFGNSVLSFHVITERIILFSTSSFIKAVKGLVASYYVFNIQYPVPLCPPLSFLQQFLFDIKDEHISQAVIKFVSSIDKLS